MALLLPGIGVLLFLLSAGLVSCLVHGVRRYAFSRGLLDIPNARSSHSHPTPRGGGIAVAGIGLLALPVLAGLGLLDWTVVTALGGGGAVVAALGWLDDLHGLRWRWRVLGQALAAGWAVAVLGGFPALDLGVTVFPLGTAGVPLAVVGIVWGTNFYNFMDGIDGLASGQAVFVGLAGALLLTGAGQAGLALVCVVLAGCAAGFLRHNWMPARIFLGDVGSTWLGFTLTTIGVVASIRGAVPMPVWALLLGVFVFDATVTLVRRLHRGHAAADPHREHAFCRTVRWGWSHARVTSAVMLLNLPLAALALLAWLVPWLQPVALGCALAITWSAYRWVEHRLPMAPHAAPALRVETGAPDPAVVRLRAVTPESRRRLSA